MPFFNFLRAGQPSAPNAAPVASPESVEVVRKRARHRLIGAAVLVLVGVVGFPLLFDTQPRPVAVDIPIEIPGKTAVKPLTLPVREAASAPAAAVTPPAAAVTPVAPAAPAASAAAAKVAAASSLTPKEEIVTERQKPSVAAAPPAAPAPRASGTAKPEGKAELKPAAKPADDGARAKALLDGKPVAAAEAEGRMVVQVGAFADVAKAREARLKLEKAGLKTYTQVAETKDGRRIRVRAGPFATRAEAEKAASKIKALDLPAAILTL